MEDHVTHSTLEHGYGEYAKMHDHKQIPVPHSTKLRIESATAGLPVVQVNEIFHAKV